MHRKPPPAFQFYPADWLSSTEVMLMTAAQERGYLRLLCHEWADDDCSLPDTKLLLKRLACLTRVGQLDVILRNFIPHPSTPGRIINPRLYAERQKFEAYRVERSRLGAVGRAKQLKKTGLSPGSARAEPGVSPCRTRAKNGLSPGSSFSSSLSLSLPPLPPLVGGDEKKGVDAGNGTGPDQVRLDPPSGLWDAAVRKLIESGHDRAEIRKWFTPTHELGRAPGEIHVEIPIKSVADWITRAYGLDLDLILGELADPPPAVRFHVRAAS